MKIEGSIQEIKEFVKELSKDMCFSKQQLKQIKELMKEEEETNEKEE